MRNVFILAAAFVLLGFTDTVVPLFRGSADSGVERNLINGSFLPAATPTPTPTPTPLSPYKLAILKTIDSYINHFHGACFNDVIVLGDIGKYRSDIAVNLNDPLVGSNGDAKMTELGRKGLAAHDSSGRPNKGHTSRSPADIYFRTVPGDPTFGLLDKLTFSHEITHHMEWLDGVKQPSDNNPPSERNTDYQDEVSIALQGWVTDERKLKDTGDLKAGVIGWKAFAKKLAALEKGLNGLGQNIGRGVHDANLKQLTGFDVELAKIRQHYLDKKCGVNLKAMVLAAEQLPEILHINFEGPNEKQPARSPVVGQTVRITASPANGNYDDQVIPPIFSPRIDWEIDGVPEVPGPVPTGSLEFTPKEAKRYEITAKQMITVDKQDYLIIANDYTLTVSKDENPPPDTSGRIQLKVPAETLATELVDASAIVPKAMFPDAKVASWYPESCTTGNKIDSAKLQFQNPRSGKPEIQYINYSLRSAEGSIGEAKAQILVKPVLFGGSAPGIWKAGSGPAGVRLERTPAIRMMGDKESGKVIASVEVVWMDSFAPKSLAEIEEQLKKDKGASTGLTLEPIEFAGFKGFLLDMNYIKQGSSYTGYVDLGAPDTARTGRGMALKGCIAVKFSYSASGGGMIRGQKPNIWWNDVPFLLSQTKAAAEEAKSVLRTLTLTEDGRFKDTPYNGPKLDGSDLPSVRLVLSPNQQKLKSGDLVRVTAVIENEAKAPKPITYEWSGDHAGSGANVTVVAGKPGKQTLSVNVPDVGMAAVEFEITEDPAAVAAQAAAEKIARAKKLAGDGSLDEAIALADEAAALNPTGAEAASLGSRWKSDRSRISRYLQNANSLADTNKFREAQTELASAKALNARYPPVLETERILTAKAAKHAAAAAEARLRLLEGNSQYESSAYRPAIDSYTKAIAADPLSAEAYAGRCLAKRGISDATAADDCEQALKLDPKNASAYRGRSMIRRVNNDLQGALADAERAVSLAPAEYRAYLTRGLAYDALKDYTKALADYEHSLALNSAYMPSYLYRGTDRLRLKDYIGARADLDRYLTAEPNSSIGHNNRGSARENLGDRDGAIADYEAAVRLDPTNLTAKNNLDRLTRLAAPTPAPSPGPGGGPPTSRGIYYPLDLTSLGGKKGQARELKGIQVDDGSYLRLKGTDNERLTYTLRPDRNVISDGIAVVSVLDDSVHVLQGMTVARITVVKDSGNEVFEIKAGIHSSEWNRSDGPKHSAAEQPAVLTLRRPGTITAIKFDYVDPKVHDWWGHAPGFCLKGVSLIASSTAGGTSPTPKPTPVPAATPARVVELLSSMNTGGVSNRPTAEARFDTNRPYMITSIMTYHWNSGHGTSSPGTISIRASNGKVYGPYTATGLSAGSVSNAFWEVKPYVVLPPGNYVIVDSDPSTWAQNSQSGGRGFTTIRGYLAPAGN